MPASQEGATLLAVWVYEHMKYSHIEPQNIRPLFFGVATQGRLVHSMPHKSSINISVFAQEEI
jgi:hypothetical protein